MVRVGCGGNNGAGSGSSGRWGWLEVRSKTSMWSGLDLIWMWLHVCMATEAREDQMKLSLNKGSL